MGSFYILVFLFGLSVCAENTPSLQGILTAGDKQRLREVFQRTKVDSLENAFYVSQGAGILGDSGSVKSRVCDYVKRNVPDASDVASLYYASSVEASLSCNIPLKVNEKSLKDRLAKADYNLTELYYIVSSLAKPGSKVNEKSITVNKVADLAEAEDSILSYGTAFLTGSLIQSTDYSQLMDLIEDIAAQADESPTALYFEGGLVPTSIVIRGILELGKTAKKKPTFSALQATFFGNYILSIRHTQSAMEAYYVLSAAQALATNEFITPVGLTRVNKRMLNANDQNFEVRLANALGDSIGKSDVTLVSISSGGKDTTVNKPFTANKDGSTYSYPLYKDISNAGVYRVTLSTRSEDSTGRVPSLLNVQFPVTIGFAADVTDAQLTILEKDQNVAVKQLKLVHPKKYSEQLLADQHSKVKMTFKLSNKHTKDTVTLHQTFIQLTSSEGEDIYFVATPTPDGVYTFELDVAKSAKDSFNSKSGTYRMTLIVGGASVVNPFSWEICSLELKFPDVTSGGVSEDEEYRYKAKPVIEHMYAKPEKRPPQVISMAFSVMVIMPLVVLIPIWLFIGANFSKIGLSGPWAMVFHAGLAGIFMLYYCFWIKLNMFQTMKYLAVLGVITFIAGNRMLRRIAKT